MFKLLRYLPSGARSLHRRRKLDVLRYFELHSPALSRMGGVGYRKGARLERAECLPSEA